jgi:lipopolysaccharide export system protein LptA
MKKSLSACLITIALAFPLFAQIKDLTIDADKVSFDRAKNRVEAAGSVEVNYRDIRLRGSHLIYNTSAETFHADQGFIFLYAGTTFEGEELDYDIKARQGVAGNVSFLYQEVSLGGAKINFNDEKFQISNAYFTTCDLGGPHYRVTAGDLILYPKERWLVAYWGYFWLGNVPVVPMPTYIYNFNLRERAQTPFPDIGYNSEDGNYLNETLAWNLRRELNGTYTLSYFSNKGLGLGATANYIINDRNNGDVRLSWNSKDTLVGGVTHRLSFGETVAETQKAPFDLSFAPRLRQYELEMTLSSRERINYQRVSFAPNFQLYSRGGQLVGNAVKYDLELGAGRVAEENNARMVRGGGKLKLYSDLPETAAGFITPSLMWDSLYYSNGAKWVKPSLGLEVTKNFSKELSLQTGYTHYLFFDGLSPFNYELYRYRAADKLAGSLMFKIGETKGRVAASYYLNDWLPEDIDYTLFFILHCYNLEVTYRSLRNEFMLGFSLASR